MNKVVKLGNTLVGSRQPVYVVAEIGINHNGDIETAKSLIDAAVRAGCNAVKFQKRTPEICVPPEQRSQMRHTPWGHISYLEYRNKVELGIAEYRELDRYCRANEIPWFASCWDEPSVDFIEQFDPPCYKIPSAALTDSELLEYHLSTHRPIVMSTGMSTISQIRAAVSLLEQSDLILLHCNSSYPCPVDELNLRTIATLAELFDCPVGYSGHEVGLATTLAAVTLNACFIERHITLDRAMWGSDQAASLEPLAFERMVKWIRSIESALGDGVKRVYPQEEVAMKRLRRKDTLIPAS